VNPVNAEIRFTQSTASSDTSNIICTHGQLGNHAPPEIYWIGSHPTKLLDRCPGCRISVYHDGPSSLVIKAKGEFSDWRVVNYIEPNRTTFLSNDLFAGSEIWAWFTEKTEYPFWAWFTEKTEYPYGPWNVLINKEMQNA